MSEHVITLDISTYIYIVALVIQYTLRRDTYRIV